MEMRVVLEKIVNFSDSALKGVYDHSSPFTDHFLVLFMSSVAPLTIDSITKAETKMALLKESWMFIALTGFGVGGYYRGRFDGNFLLLSCCTFAISALAKRLIQVENNYKTLEDRVSKLEAPAPRDTATKKSPYNLRRSARKATPLKSAQSGQ